MIRCHHVVAGRGEQQQVLAPTECQLRVAVHQQDERTPRLLEAGLQDAASSSGYHLADQGNDIAHEVLDLLQVVVERTDVEGIRARLRQC